MFAVSFLQAPISGNLSGFIYQAAVLPQRHFVGCEGGSWDGHNLVPSPRDDHLPQTNENRLNRGQNLKIINLREKPSPDSGNVPYKKTKNMPDYVSSASFIKSAKIMLVFPNYAKTLASTIDEGLLLRGRDTVSKVQSRSVRPENPSWFLLTL